MSVKKIFFLLPFIILTLTVFEACSANRKMKKKCQDCPEFSQTEEKQQTIAQWNEDK
jgi:hypothetical protein